MSAWVVSKDHIDLLVSAAIAFPNLRCQGSKRCTSPTTAWGYDRSAA